MKLMWIKGKNHKQMRIKWNGTTKLDFKNGWNKIQICTQWWNQI